LRNKGSDLMPNSEKFKAIAAELRSLAAITQVKTDREQLLSIAARFEDCAGAVEEMDAHYRKLCVHFRLVA
jgi:hypothetical protein